MATSQSTTEQTESLQPKDSNTVPELTSRCENVLRNLNEMRLEENGTDVSITCDEVTFPAHKLVLMAASPVFKTMFRSSFKEADRHAVDMKIESTVMEKILDFIYLSEDAPLDFDNVEEAAEAVEAAHYLQMETLFRTCFERFVKMASANDFPLLCSLAKYEQVEEFIKKFTAEKGLAILDQGVHLEYNFEQFLMFVQEMKHCVHSRRLLSEIIKWLHGSDNDKNKYGEDLIVLVDITTLSRESIKFFLDEEVVKSNKALTLLFCQQSVTAPEKDIELVKPNELKIFQFFISNEQEHYFLETTFDAKGFHARKCNLPFRLQAPIHCLYFKNDIHLVCGSVKKDRPFGVRYSRNSNAAQWGGRSSTGMYVKHVYSFKTRQVYIANSDTNDAGYVVYGDGWNMKICNTGIPFWNSVWVPCETMLLQLPVEASTKFNIFRYYETQTHRTNETTNDLFPKESHFPFPVKFPKNTTVSFRDTVYAFVKDDMHIFDPNSSRLSCTKSGITLQDGDVLFPLPDYKQTFYVVIRRNHSATEFVYKLWNVESKCFQAEAVAKKGAVCETVAYVP